ncbi:bifunctional diguanylate cyclase/phosphodiesterase [Franconibacter pulveris 601]|uniref:bifunctional diguanylate cyclase/phosphodiesterase n=1 Tax=Franconibacter pulveris TaxID=435910 RepID=UPI000AAC233E|nr:EAL domain-containing protein [Franconibacter pulveris]
MMRWLAIKENTPLFTSSAGSTTSVVKRSLMFMLSLLGTFFLIAILALLHIACDINNRADDQSRNLLQKALQNQEATMKVHTQDYAEWGESYTHLHKTLDTDWAWQKQNLGASLFEDFHYEAIFVLGPGGDTRYAVVNGKRVRLTLEQWAGTHPQAALRTALARKPDEPAALSLAVNGQPALVAAAWITTGGDEDVQPLPGPPSMLVFIDQLRPAELRELGEEYGIHELHVQTDSSSKADYRQVVLPLTFYNAPIALAWRSENPGRNLLLVVLPLLLSILLLTALLAAWLMRNALNKARLNDENHFLLEQSRQALAASERRFRDVVEATTDWIWETDDQLRFTWISERFPVITGHRIDDWLGRPITQFIECEQIELADWLLQPGQTAHRGLTHCRYFSAQGHQRYCNLVAKPTTTAEGELSYRGTATDVTLEVEAQARVQYLSRHDELTGLPNRVRMKEFLEGKLQSMPTRDHPLAMISLDLDKFKPVNDLFGHGVGDEVLHQVSERLRACLREFDLVARQGGDEFILIIPDIEQKQDLDQLCERIIREIRRPLYIQEHEIFIGASMGIALAPQDAVNATDLLRYSDIALYKAKSAGRNGWVFYSADMEEQIVQRREMEKSLREALKEDQFRLVYQPRYDMKAGRVVAVEALLRWHHPLHGLLMPDQFIPLAEETGIIISLSDWVLNTACRDAQHELQGMSVSVNISAVEFQTSGLVGRVRDALRASKLDPARLELEVTENATLWNPQSSLEIMNGLKALGVRLLIDDFGTGYSSLSYLRNFPFDGIKLDKSFVAGMPHSENANNIVENMIGLGKAFSLSITAEGVETPEQLEQLKMYQCDETQGYLISRPMPLEELKAQIEKR